MFIKFITEIICPFVWSHLGTSFSPGYIAIISHYNSGHSIRKIKYNNLLAESFSPDPSDLVEIVGISSHDAIQSASKMRAAQWFWVERFFRIQAPSYTVRILFLARAYSNFSLRRMQQQLNIADVRKLLHTKDVKGDSIIGYSDRWPFVPYLSKLIPYDLIPFQVECTQFSLIDFPYSHMLVYTVGDIVIHLWIIIYIQWWLIGIPLACMLLSSLQTALCFSMMYPKYPHPRKYA